MTDLDPATPRPSGTRADAPPRTDVALRPVAADDADFLWTWIHGAEDPEWKSWDAPYFHAADTAAPARCTRPSTSPTSWPAGTPPR